MKTILKVLSLLFLMSIRIGGAGDDVVDLNTTSSR